MYITALSFYSPTLFEYLGLRVGDEDGQSLKYVIIANASRMIIALCFFVNNHQCIDLTIAMTMMKQALFTTSFEGLLLRA